jgi:RimJ/RimL family protein N-acetyltransferase
VAGPQPGDLPIEFPVEGLSDGVVRLRLMAEADVGAIVAACQDPEIPRWTRVPEPYGAVGIGHVDPQEGRCELGYWMARESRERGLATRAVRLLSRWVFESLPIDRIEIHAEPGNAASRRVAERAGFSFEGVLRAYLLHRGVRRDAASYSLLRGELP